MEKQFVPTFEAWHDGMEFGKSRNDVPKRSHKKGTKTLDKKLAAIDKTYQKILKRWDKDKHLKVKVRPAVMSKITTVDADVALRYLDKKRYNLVMGGDGLGIIVYG